MALCTLLAFSGLATSAQAHGWTPNDSTAGEEYPVGHDDSGAPGTSGYESDWPTGLMGGSIWWQMDVYDHAGHIHLDHIQGWFKQTPDSTYGTILSVNGHYRLFEGKCVGHAIQYCIDNNDVRNKFAEGDFPTITDAGPLHSKFVDFGLRRESANITMAVAYNVAYKEPGNPDTLHFNATEVVYSQAD